jgi:hypothetical protein
MGPSWEATNNWATQEFPNILENTEVHYHIHKSPLIAILSQISQVHATPNYLCNIHFNM